jgi:integrase
MPKLKMTDAVVRQTTAAPGDRVDYFDAHPRDRQRGLVLRVSGAREKDGSAKVTRTWAVLCRVRGSTKLRRFTIGDYPGYGLSEARDAAAEIIKQTRRDGLDPLKERKRAAVEAEIAGRDTVSELVSRFMGDLAKRPKKNGGMRAARYIEETQRNFDNHVLPRWGSKNIREITRRDVSDLIDAVAYEGTDLRDPGGEKRHADGGGIAANRVYAAVRAFFNWALDGGIIDATPAARAAKRGDEIKRERTLSDDEIRVIWPQARALGYSFGPFFCMALVTGQRRDEVATMRWADIDEKTKLWTIPKQSTKAKREHVVPLSDLALSLLAEAKQAATALTKVRMAGEKLGKSAEMSPFVFSTRAKRPISGFSKAKADLDERVSADLKKARRSSLGRWTIHDLRRTCATGMGALGVDPFVIGRVLNHADRTVTGIYNRHSYLAEKKAALDKWADHVVAATKPRSAAGDKRSVA